MRRTRLTSLCVAAGVMGLVPVAAQAKPVRPGGALVKTSLFKGSWDRGGGGPSWGKGGGGQSYWKHVSDWRGHGNDPGHGHEGRGHFWHGNGHGHDHHPGDDDNPCSP